MPTQNVQVGKWTIGDACRRTHGSRVVDETFDRMRPLLESITSKFPFGQGMELDIVVIQRTCRDDVQPSDL